jgi:hypothetical protein
MILSGFASCCAASSIDCQHILRNPPPCGPRIPIRSRTRHWDFSEKICSLCTAVPDSSTASNQGSFQLASPVPAHLHPRTSKIRIGRHCGGLTNPARPPSPLCPLDASPRRTYTSCPLASSILGSSNVIGRWNSSAICCFRRLGRRGDRVEDAGVAETLDCKLGGCRIGMEDGFDGLRDRGRNGVLCVFWRGWVVGRVIDSGWTSGSVTK